MYVYEVHEAEPEFNYVSGNSVSYMKTTNGWYYFYCETRLRVPKKFECLEMLQCGDCGTFDVKTPYECYCGCTEIYSYYDDYIRWRYVHL